MITLRLVIQGRVQGVGYRAWLAERARDADVRGWVRNRRDGAVEALLHTGSGSLDGFIAVCRQGPALARVTAIEIIEEPAESPDGFRILPTV